MPDLHVNSATGTDTAGGGDTAAAALRSLTFAVGEGARRFGVAPTNIYLAAGTYSAATGEIFPIEMAQNVRLLGSGIRSTIIRFERTVGGGLPLGGFEVALSGGGELADFTLQGLPRDLGACFTSFGIEQTTGTTDIHDVVVEAAPGTPAGDVAFGTGLALSNEARVERVEVSGCGGGIWFNDAATLVSSCNVHDNQRGGVIAGGAGTIRGCTLTGNHKGAQIFASGATVDGNAVSGCAWGIYVEDTAAPGAIISGNNLIDNYYGIACFGEAVIEDNDVSSVFNEFGITIYAANPPTRYAAAPVIRPTVRNNRVVRVGRDSRWQQPMMVIGGAAQPVIEGNRFWRSAGSLFNFIEVHVDALPDFGSRSPGSMGGNRFEAGWIVFHQDGIAPSKDVFAQDNHWIRVPPIQGFDIYTPRDWYVTPHTRRSEVTLRTDGAISL